MKNHFQGQLKKLQINGNEAISNDSVSRVSPNKSKSDYMPSDFIQHHENEMDEVDQISIEEKHGHQIDKDYPVPKINIMNNTLQNSFQFKNSQHMSILQSQQQENENLLSSYQQNPSLMDSQIVNKVNLPKHTQLNIQTDVLSPKITPGFTKYMIDEQNAQFDYVRGMFTEEEVKDAFTILDMNKDGAITSEDLLFFLDFIGEKATQEEVEEMIKMCDRDGGGDVKYEEFFKMAGGWSLTPIGQAYPPTKELIEKRNYLNQLMMDKELTQIQGSDQTQQLQLTGQGNVQNDKGKSQFSPHFGQDVPQQFSTITALNAPQKKKRQMIGTNLKVIRSEEGQLTMQNKQQSTLSQKEVMSIRYANCSKFVKDSQYELNSIIQLFHKVVEQEIQIIQHCTFEQMMSILEMDKQISQVKPQNHQQNYQNLLLFNALTDQPLREEYVKNSQHLLTGCSINLKNMLLTFIGFVEARTVDKLELSYQIQDSSNHGYIFVDELLKMVTYLHCLPDSNNFEKKIQKILSKKGLKSKTDAITKDIFLGMINEYGQVFENI